MANTENSPCELRSHLARIFPGRRLDTFRWKAVPLQKSLPNLEILRLSPLKAKDGWFFFSNGVAETQTGRRPAYEFFLVAPEDDPVHIETLSMLCNFAVDPRFELYPGKIVDIGRGWVPDSNLDHLLISLPYIWGPRLEHCGSGPLGVKILWLQPIASSEALFVEEHGLEALEKRFEDRKLNYMALKRVPVA